MQQRTITENDINEMSKIYRLNLINSISGFKSANLIGTSDSDGNQNLAIFSSVIHLGSNPPVLGMVLRPTTVPRHTYENIQNNGVYTINSVTSAIIDRAHQTSAKYEKGEDEFEKVGLTPEYKGGITAPYVKESLLQIGMEFIEEIDIKANGTKLLIGKVKEIYVLEESVTEDGAIDLSKTDTVAISGLDTYWSTKKLQKFSYARPK